MRASARWTWTALAVLGAAAMLAAIPRADAEDPETGEPKGLASVRAAIKMVVTTQDGPIPGTPREKALPMVTNWAAIQTDKMTPLEGSLYALGPDATGLVRVFVGKEGADDLSIHLFVKDVERTRLRAFVMDVGRELGYAMKADSIDPWACHGSAAGRRDLWIGVGVGLVSIEVNTPP